MRTRLLIMMFTCVCASAQAQVNFVKNPGFEEYSKCPTSSDQLTYSKFWRGAIDSSFWGEAEYFNSCSNMLLDISLHVPNNNAFYQSPHLGNGMVGAHLYYDKTIPPPPDPLPFNYRDYVQGHLLKSLIKDTTYCISFWVNLAEASGYAHSNIGAYLDDGAINGLVDSAGKEILSVIPQVYGIDVVEDTLNWIKISGSFRAKGNETHITIGNFFPNSSITSVVTNYWFGYTQYSYYLIDDVSVIPVELPADAGPNRWVELGKQVKIGRVGDPTTLGLDCKWYHKGVLIDSGAVIDVQAKSISGVIDTYVVVQIICGLVKTDTVTVTTVPLGVKEWAQENVFSVYPNPSDGAITITAKGSEKSAILKVYDLLGRTIKQQSLMFIDQQTTLNLDAPSGTYILEMTTQPGTIYRQRINLK